MTFDLAVWTKPLACARTRGSYVHSIVRALLSGQRAVSMLAEWCRTRTPSGQAKVVGREVVVGAINAPEAGEAPRSIVGPGNQTARRQLFQSVGRDAALDSSNRTGARGGNWRFPDTRSPSTSRDAVDSAPARTAIVAGRLQWRLCRTGRGCRRKARHRARAIPRDVARSTMFKR